MPGARFSAYPEAVFDIGIGEIMVLAVLGLLIFGPERLPRAASDAAAMMRNVRAMATNARKDALRGLQDLHPKNMVAGIFDDGPEATPPPTKGSSAAAPTARFDPDAT